MVFFSTLYIEKHHKVLTEWMGNNATFLLKGKKWKVSEGYLFKKERYFDPTVNMTGKETLDQDH